MSRLEDKIEIANPTQPHCATVLLLDTSGSMSVGDKITSLNEGLRTFKEAISSDELASKRVDLAVITFGEAVNVMHDFSSIEDFDPPTLTAGGTTPMGEAIVRAADMIEERKKHYRAQGVDYYRPWVFMITDGDPTDMSPGEPRWTEVVNLHSDTWNGVHHAPGRGSLFALNEIRPRQLSEHEEMGG